MKPYVRPSAFFFSCVVALNLFAVLAFAKSAPKFTGTINVEGKSKSDYSALAKISLKDAIAIGMKQSPGKVVEAVLEDEGGYLIYEIELQSADRSKKEYVIDAGDGKVLLVKERGPSSKEDDNDEQD